MLHGRGTIVVYKGKFEIVTKSLNNSAICISPSKNNEQRSIFSWSTRTWIIADFSCSLQILLVGNTDWMYYRSSACQVAYIHYHLYFNLLPSQTFPPRQISTENRVEDNVNGTYFPVLQCYLFIISCGPNSYSSILSASNSKSYSQVPQFFVQMTPLTLDLQVSPGFVRLFKGRQSNGDSCYAWVCIVPGGSGKVCILGQDRICGPMPWLTKHPASKCFQVRGDLLLRNL